MIILSDNADLVDAIAALDANDDSAIALILDILSQSI